MDEQPYVVRLEQEDGYAVYVLEDRAACAEAWVVPGLGFNVFRFSVAPDEQEAGIVDPPPALADLRQSPLGYGIPILFPFPGRIPGGRFAFRGRTYNLPPRREGGEVMHGLVLDRPWAVTAVEASAHGGALVAGRFESADFGELAWQYPSAFRLDVAWRLQGWALHLEARAENTGREPLPVGLGLHPYLHAPIDHDSSVGGCLIAVPATRRWELVNHVPTGRQEPVEEDLAAGVGLEGRSFDAVYTGLQPAQGPSCAVLSDTRARLAVAVEADAQFRNWVVYTPPRPAVCLEPWTCAPNAINLQEQDVDAGLVVLEPGECRRWTVQLAVRRL